MKIDDIPLRECVAVTYAALCGYAFGEVTAGSHDLSVQPGTLRDLEDFLVTVFGMTRDEVLAVRQAALDGAPDGDGSR